MLNITQIPAPRVPFIDERTNLMSREWYRFFLNLFTLTGSGSDTTTLLDLQVGPPTLPSIAPDQLATVTAALAQTQSDVNALALSPQVQNIAPTPYGSFYDTTNQVGSITVPTPVKFNSTDVSSGVYIGATTSQIYVTQQGVYNFQFSVQVENTIATPDDINLWLRIGGVNVIGSNGLIFVPGKHAGANGHIIAGWNFFLTLSSGQYVELVWLPVTATTTLAAYPAIVGPPAVPSTYSAVLTAFKVNITAG